jgi:hypothetical protein
LIVKNDIFIIRDGLLAKHVLYGVPASRRIVGIH